MDAIRLVFINGGSKEFPISASWPGDGPELVCITGCYQQMVQQQLIAPWKDRRDSLLVLNAAFARHLPVHSVGNNV